MRAVAGRLRRLAELQLLGALADGQPIPEPSSLDAVMTDADHREAAAIMLVDVPVKREKAARYNITMLPYSYGRD